MQTINWNKYQSNVSMQTKNGYLDYLIKLSFQRVKRLFVILFENVAGRKKTQGIPFQL